VKPPNTQKLKKHWSMGSQLQLLLFSPTTFTLSSSGEALDQVPHLQIVVMIELYLAQLSTELQRNRHHLRLKL